jgi:hypothetical protein
LAAVLSLVVPGLGQLYKRQIVLGLLFLVSTLIGYSRSLAPGALIHAVAVVNSYFAQSAEEQRSRVHRLREAAARERFRETVL